MTDRYSKGLLERTAAGDWLQLLEGAQPGVDIQGKRAESEAYDALFEEFARVDDHIESLVRDGEFADQLQSVISNSPPLTGLRKLRRNRLTPWGIAASLLIGAALLFLGQQTADLPATSADRYVTRTGEQRSLALADGSSVMMNTGTQLLVEITDRQRSIRMERGEAYFSVRGDAERPFVVNLDGRNLTVLGTAFNVRKTVDGFQLVVMDGLVAYHLENQPLSSHRNVPVAKNNGATSISTDEQWLVKKGVAVEFDLSRGLGRAYQPENIDRLTDWRSGIIRFEETSLFDVILELNRYSAKKILIGDQSLAGLKVNALIRVSDINMALTVLSRGLPIEVNHQFDQILITKKGD